jgi:hypothetical protein
MVAAALAASGTTGGAAFRGGATAPGGTLGATLKALAKTASAPALGGTTGLSKSSSLPAPAQLGPLVRRVNAAKELANPPKFQAPKIVTYTKCTDKTVTLESLMRFLFPPKLENSNSTGRLELFARYGPADEDGNLRGGSGGSHVHTDNDVAQMIREDCREGLFRQFNRPRSDVEVIVDTLLPTAMSSRDPPDEIKHILRKVSCDGSARMNFSELQRTVLERMDKRLKAIVARVEAGKPIAPPKERGITVGFQSEPWRVRMELTKKKKFSGEMEQEQAMARRQNSYNTLIAPIEQQGLARQMTANVLLLRPIGDVDERWDRYCSLRRTGRASYVRARNENRNNPSLDEGLTNKHPGVSSLLAASAAGSSAAVQLAC